MTLEILLNYLAALGDEIVPGVLFAKVDGKWYGSVHRFPDGTLDSRDIYVQSKQDTYDELVERLFNLTLARQIHDREMGYDGN